jgi:hypothetical protein
MDICSVSGQKVLPSELERSAVSGKKALGKFLISSSISDARMLEDEAIYSTTGSACTPSEARQCDWSGEAFHPDDFVECSLTGLSIASRFTTLKSPARLKTLSELLNCTDHSKDRSEAWSRIAKHAENKMHGSCRIETAHLSPDRRQLAVSAEVKTMFGFWVQHVGFIYVIDSDRIRGRIAVGKRSSGRWKPS